MRKGAPKSQSGGKNIKGRIAVIVAEFNSDITHGLRDGALRTLNEAGFSESSIDVMYAPGSFELPLAAKLVLKKKKHIGVIALGAVIKGDTDHYYYVADAATYGLLRVTLDAEKPVAFGVLTTETLDQAKARAGKVGNKGSEAAEALLSMLRNF